VNKKNASTVCDTMQSRNFFAFVSAICVATTVFPTTVHAQATSTNAPPPARTVHVPNGFEYEVLLQGETPEPVDLDFSPDGKLWITSRRGWIWSYDLKTKTRTEVAHLDVDFEQQKGKENNERGLHGIEFDPNFLKNGYLYLYYSPMGAGERCNRFSRFTVKNPKGAAMLQTNSEKIYLTIPSTKGFHQGGAIEYNRKDGKLYVSSGDNNVSGDTKNFYNDPNNPPQLLSDLRGKTLRFNLDGSIPKDNPFVKTPGARPEIYTFGHRNPYSMNIDPETGSVFVGEVGYDRPEDFEEINLLKAGANYGWPRCIGTNNGTYGGPCPIEDATMPFFSYIHDRGASVTSGPFYRANKGEFAFPAEYQNGMFYADYARKWIRFLQVDPKTYTVTKSVPFGTGFVAGALSMKTGPDGALYFVEYGGWFTPSPNDRVARIKYKH
jgi:glucose/arabinose dehydrogenase